MDPDDYCMSSMEDYELSRTYPSSESDYEFWALGF